MNTFHKLSPFLLVVFIAFFLPACGKHDASKLTDGNDCRPQLAKCNITVAGVKAEFWLEQEEYANEIPLLTNVRLSDPTVQMISAKLTGDNMYMGYIPVILEAGKSSLYSGEMYLATCTRDDMRWRLTITARSPQGKEIEFTFQFDAPK
ncbi:hypothetical protein [Corallincola luteus]|nr:hypothetical protein [Corallincola luteus]